MDRLGRLLTDSATHTAQLGETVKGMGDGDEDEEDDDEEEGGGGVEEEEGEGVKNLEEEAEEGGAKEVGDDESNASSEDDLFSPPFPAPLSSSAPAAFSLGIRGAGGEAGRGGETRRGATRRADNVSVKNENCTRLYLHTRRTPPYNSHPSSQPFCDSLRSSQTEWGAEKTWEGPTVRHSHTFTR